MNESKTLSRNKALALSAVVAALAFWLGTRFESARAETYRIAHPEDCMPEVEPVGAVEANAAVIDPPQPRPEDFAQSPEEQQAARERATLAGLMPDGGPVSLIRAAAVRRNAFRIVDEALTRGSLTGEDRATLLTILPDLSEQDRATITERIARIGAASPTPPAP